MYRFVLGKRSPLATGWKPALRGCRLIYETVSVSFYAEDQVRGKALF